MPRARSLVHNPQGADYIIVGHLLSERLDGALSACGRFDALALLLRLQVGQWFLVLNTVSHRALQARLDSLRLEHFAHVLGFCSVAPKSP